MARRGTTTVMLMVCGLAAGHASGVLPAAGLVADLPAGVSIGGVLPTSLYLRPATVDTSIGVGGIGRSCGPAAAGRQFVIQLDGPITPARRARLEGAGVWVGPYLPMYAYVVRLDGADPAAVDRLEFIRWHAEYSEAWKLDPELGRAPSTPDGQALAARGRRGVVVTLFPTLTREELHAARAAVRDRPGVAAHSEDTIGGAATIVLDLPAGGEGGLAAIPGVMYVEPAPEVTLRNDTTRWIVQSNQAGAYPLYANGLHGEGQIVGILDSAVNRNHCSFSDTVPIGPTHRKIVAYNAAAGSASHGTHVAGIAVGDAGNETATRGVAYLGKLAYAPIPAFNEAAVMAALNLHHSQGARVHTNSWGNDGTTAYDSLCRGFDSFQYQQEESFVCLAVTNQSLLKNPENAKNLLAVGNCNDTPTQGNVCTGGAGPTSDGRRKPEIFAPGCGANSAASGTSCGTTAMTGTSMASPAVAGVAMMIREYFMDGYYPGGVPSTPAGFTPSSALIKAALLNSAVDMTGPAGYPSNAEGWGRVLADQALYFAGDSRQMLVSDVRHAQGLVTGGEATVNVNVLGSGQQVRFTLVWTEPPATAGAAFAAVNDLDLEVTAPTGVYKGNVFSGGASVTGGNRDDRNNVEQVHINAPAPGAYAVKIRGFNVAQGTQGYALVVTGQIEGGEPPALVINLPSGTPSLIAPGVATDIAVQVFAGSQQVVPGSPTLYYRSAPGPFAATPLTPLGGKDYRATLPAALCGAQPEFYFRADGDGGATALLPGNAPASVLSASIGVIQVNTVLTETFEGSLPAGWTATGLWNLTASCNPAGACEGARFAYYGQTSGANSCTFNTGATTTGSLTSAPIQLPAGGPVSLRYCSSLLTEALAGYDKAEVLANGTVVDTAGESSAWETRNVDLSAFAGQTVTLQWRFDSVDGQFNTFRGWQVDDVRVTASGVACVNPCYADCNADAALTVADFGCFQSRFVQGDPYADCDASGQLSVADFGCFQTKFVAGCP